MTFSLYCSECKTMNAAELDEKNEQFTAVCFKCEKKLTLEFKGAQELIEAVEFVKTPPVGGVM